MKEELDEFWGQKKALKPGVVVKALFSHDVITVLRRELNRQADGRLDMDDVVESVKAIVTKDSLMDAGDIVLSKKKRKKRKAKAATETSPHTSDDKPIDPIPSGSVIKAA